MFRASLASIGLKVVGAVLWLVFNVILAKALSVEDFGLFSFAVSSVTLLGTAACFGYGQILMRDGSIAFNLGQSDRFRGILAAGRRAIILSSIVYAIVILVLHQAGIFIPIFKSGLILMTVLVSAPLFGFMILHREGLRAHGHLSGALLSFNILRSTIPLIGFGFALIAFKPSAELAMASWTVGFFIILIVDCLRLYPAAWLRKLEAPSNTNMKEASVFWVGELTNLLLLQGPILIAGIVLDLQAAALLYAAHRLATLSLFGIDGIRIAIAPQIARAAADTDAVEAERIISRVSALWMLTGLLFALPVLVLAPVLLGLFGHEYIPATLALIVMTIGRLFQALSGPTGPLMNYGNMERARAGWTLVASMGQIVGAIYLGTRFGITGIAFAMLASIIVLEVASLCTIRRRKGIWIGIVSVIQSPTAVQRAIYQLRMLFTAKK